MYVKDHSTEWMIHKLSLVNILGDYIAIPGKDAQGYTTDTWQNLSLSYASDMLNHSPEAKSYIIQDGPCKSQTFENFDKVYIVYLNDSSVDAMKQMWWIDTYAFVPFVYNAALDAVVSMYRYG